MLKLLIKKELFEALKTFFYNPKTNKMRSKKMTIFYFFLFALLMFGVMGGMFGFLAYAICDALVYYEMDYFYFIVFSVLAIILGVFGSVFNTFSSLYLGKDNDLLLSMPIPIYKIIIARLVNVYLIGFLFSGVVIIPAIIIYFIYGAFNINTIIGSLILLIVITLFVLLLSCILGFFVAKISIRLKNKSYITVIVSLIGFAIYYYLSYHLGYMIEALANNALIYGEIVTNIYPLYLFGCIATGDYFAMFIYIVVITLMCLLVWFILSKTFLNLAISTDKSKKKEYIQKKTKQGSVFMALVKKEFNRFVSSANYMLNCGLGLVFILLIAVMLVVKGDYLLFIIESILIDEFDIAFVIALGVIAMFCFLVVIDVPSISLEAKNLWIYKSLPITSWKILNSKLFLHFICTFIPLTILNLVIIIMFNTLGYGIYIVVFSSYLVLVVSTLFGMFLALKMPLLNWTNELYPIKQGINILIYVVVGMALPAIIIALYWVKLYTVDAEIYIGIIDLIFVLSSVVLYFWIKYKGTKIFEKL